MAVDLKRDRSDIVYLRRRLKPGQSVATPSAPSTASIGLRLSAPEEKPAKAGYHVPTLSESVQLTVTNPVVRLNRRQSSIGSAVVSGVTYFGWDVAGKQGTAVAGEENLPSPAYANRPVVQFHKGLAVVGLRHSRKIRRVVFGGKQGIIVFKLYDGLEVKVDTDNGLGCLYLSQIDGELELRFETVEQGDLFDTFSFR